MEEEWEAYGAFAETYDLFMDNIPYEEWHVYLRQLLVQNGVTEGIVAELGCGTGAMTTLLAEDGYDMIGVDLSVEMLEIAREKCPESVLLLHQDMRELDLFGSVSAMVCVCDGMNYLLEEQDLQQTFTRVAQFLEKDGVLIFDMKTAYFYEEQLGDRTIVDNRDDCTLIWENTYDPETMRNEYLLTIYQLEQVEADLFSRVEEYHCQRAYPVATVTEQLQKAGLTLRAVYEAFTEEPAKQHSSRVYFVAAKQS